MQVLRPTTLFFVVMIALLHLTTEKVFTMEEKNLKYQIIYLNGLSSSGKSELVKALQDALDRPFLHIGIDKVIGMMPAKLNNWEGGNAPLGYSWKTVKDEDGTTMQELQMGPFAHKISQAYREIVLSLAKLGHFIIIDDVACIRQHKSESQRSLFSRVFGTQIIR